VPDIRGVTIEELGIPQFTLKPLSYAFASFACRGQCKDRIQEAGFYTPLGAPQRTDLFPRQSDTLPRAPRTKIARGAGTFV
jgi:hypothetical protein